VESWVEAYSSSGIKTAILENTSTEFLLRLLCGLVTEKRAIPGISEQGNAFRVTHWEKPE